MISKNKKEKESYFVSRSTLSQICAVFVKNLVLIGYGMSMAFPTILIPDLSQKEHGDPLHIGIEETSWMGSITLITIPFGCLVSGIVTQPLGRRRSMQLINIPFCISWICYYFSSKIWHIFTILFVIGFNGGLMEAPVLTYVAEISQPHLRGMLSSSALVTTAAGVLLQFTLGNFLDWRSISICSAIIPIISFFLLFFIPETPIWLISRKRYEEAKESLAWLRGWVNVEDITEEYEEIFRSMHATTMVEGNKLIEIYAVAIFNSFKAPIDGHFATALMGLTAMIGSIVSVIAVGKLGRRLLTFISLIATAISFTIIGTYAYFFNITTFLKSENATIVMNSTVQIMHSSDISKYSWIPSITIVFGMFAALLGIKVLPWSLVGEIFPNETRALGSGIMGMIYYLLGFICNKTFFTMISIMSLAGTFFFYSAISFTGFIILYFVLPETEGSSLQEITDHFAGKSKLGNKISRGKKHISIKEDEATEKLYHEVEKSLP
ncbi:hypothetical protein WA026_014859 [Henosepilachna vigintioctopunctata]|uniref:Major facilitator superfamily (MFS) profile domain-containing protein n=1 Tax=Henosepilachna vigintioctopunctata TaxID=420089 RepID=A0AAW1UYV7_9CUCU